MLAVAIICSIIFLALAAYALFVETRRFRTVRVRMHTRRSLGGKLEVLHISDAHFRKGDEAKLDFVRSLHETPVDMVVVTGDMIEDDSGIDYCVNALRGFKTGIGVFAVFGAHDHWDSTPWNVVLDLGVGGYHQGPSNDFERLKRELAGAGVVCLGNESRRIALPGPIGAGSSKKEELWIVGIDDMFVGLDDMDKALAGVPDDAFTILLTHTVESPEELAAHGFDAVFAGHSHGGQVRFPLFGPVMTRSSLRRKYASGVFEVAGTTFHLNNGVGAGKWTDFRFLCPPEATYVELTGRNDAIKPV